MGDNSKLTSYFFAVELDGIESAHFRKCCGLEAETEVIEIEEGGGGVHRFKGRTRFPNLVLEQGICDNDELLKWFRNWLEGKTERKSGSVVLYDLEYNEIQRWNFFRAFPCRWVGPKLDCKMRDTLAVERIEIAHEGLELDDAYASDSSGDSFWSKFADGVQAGLDIAGLIPGVGEIADGVNALISLGRGDVAGATLSATSMLPIVGDAIGKGGKIARAAIKHGDEVLEAAGKVAGSKATSKMTKPYATSRPSYGKGQVEQVWENAKDPVTGKVYDPSGIEITWDLTKPRNGQWDMGHIPGEKYSQMHQLYMDDVISKEEFLEWYRNPANYRPELPRTNRSRRYE